MSRPDPGITASYQRSALLAARALIFASVDAPLNHVPDWKHIDEATSFPICQRCVRPVGAREWAGEICPGGATP